ncbi:MAG: glycosyltransferase [bacterium]|nr:glycosyltransferase [bacterium]
MKIVVTGGHIAPALAVIESLPKEVEVIFIGRKNTFESDASVSFEYAEITKRGIPFKTLPSARLQRSISRHTIPSLLRLPNNIRLARKLLREIHPSVVLSFGGYIGLPTVIAASTLSIPVVIHEQTTRAGFANKISSRFANAICISWESSSVYFPKEKTMLTGNPLRKEILQAVVKKAKSKSRPSLYITGGSSGSHFLNLLVEKHLSELLKRASITHQTGNAYPFNDYERLFKVRELLPDSLKARYRIEKFLFSQDAAKVLASADMVVGRAGINTISELIYFEKPALCIPLSTGQKGEQEENALLLATLGLGRALLQEKADVLFLSQIDEMLSSLSSFSLNDPSVRQRFMTAAEDIIHVIFDVENKKTNKKT